MKRATIVELNCLLLMDLTVGRDRTDRSSASGASNSGGKTGSRHKNAEPVLLAPLSVAVGLVVMPLRISSPSLSVASELLSVRLWPSLSPRTPASLAL